MLLGLWVSVLFGHSEIDDMDDIGGFGTGASDKEVVGLDVSVDQVAVMNRLHSG